MEVSLSSESIYGFVCWTVVCESHEGKKSLLYAINPFLIWSESFWEVLSIKGKDQKVMPI